MKNEEIVDKLNNIHLQNFSLEDFEEQIQILKLDFVKNGNQQQAKLLWIYQTIIEIHKLYVNAFNLLKGKSYYQAWCQLERIEITLHSLKKHFSYDKKQYFLWHIEKSVKNLQVIYPYRLFASSEILKKKKKCSVCDKEISIRNSCGHIVGEIYNGEMCHRIVTEAEILGISLVENPGNKYSVMFLKDEKTDEQIDQYNYDTIDYLFEHITSPYEFWDLEVSQRETKKEDFGIVGRNDPCPCNSGKKFKKCCLLSVGKKYPHYEFIVLNPSDKTLMTNTLKNKNASRN
ncbi:MAG: SEC-C metal-binding domain-containing protein [Bacteroidales bacterium]|nr:SEC-C metal-binding domain-containing protein [Bacteroidales bacterium]